MSEVSSIPSGPGLRLGSGWIASFCQEGEWVASLKIKSCELKHVVGAKPMRNPFGVHRGRHRCAIVDYQGSRCAATLRYDVEPRWGSRAVGVDSRLFDFVRVISPKIWPSGFDAFEGGRPMRNPVGVRRERSVRGGVIPG